MKRSKLVYGSVAVVLAGAGVAIASAQTALSAFDGSYVYAGGETEKAAIAQAISTATASMARSTQNRWRAQLDEMARPLPRLTIARTGSELSVENSNGVELRSPTSGASVEIADAWDLNQRLVNGKIEQRIESDDIDQLYSYALGADRGTLTVEVRITARELSRAVTYSLPYRRR